jgi:uncharacterized protein
MNCVKCDGTLHQLRAGATVIDRCDKCDGIWFDAGEIGRVIEHVRAADFQPLSEAGALSDRGEGGGDYRGSGDADKDDGHCPRCKTPLTRTEILAFEGMHYDRCESCGGAWLDAGELKTIATDPEASTEVAFLTQRR